MGGPHRTRLIKLLENGCEDADVLKEAIRSCIQNTNQEEEAGEQSQQQQPQQGSSSHATATGTTSSPPQLGAEGHEEDPNVSSSLRGADATLTTSAVDLSLHDDTQRASLPRPLNDVSNDAHPTESVSGVDNEKSSSATSSPRHPALLQAQHSSPVRCIDHAVLGPLDFPIATAQNMTCLEIAVLTQNNTAVELLLQHGASADVVSGLSCTSLCKVCYTFPGNHAMMKLLLEAGANPDATTNNDTLSASCLIISVVKDNLQAVQLLLEYGCDASYEWKGSSALAMALDFKKDELADVLENFEFRKAQDNRWKKFHDRQVVEEQRRLQHEALQRQQQLEDQRRSMLKRMHSKDPMLAPGRGGAAGPQTVDPSSSSSSAAGSRGGGPATAVTYDERNRHSATATPTTPSQALHTPQRRRPPQPAGSEDEDVHTVLQPDGTLLVLRHRRAPISDEVAQTRSSLSQHPPLPPSNDTHHPLPQQQQQTATMPPLAPSSLAAVVSPCRLPGALAQAEAHDAANHSGVDNALVHNITQMDWLIPFSDLTLLRPISSGAHGDVSVGELASSGETVAVKQFPCLDEKSRNCFRLEVSMLSKFRHENIVLFKGAVMTPSFCAIVSELCAENLFDRLQRPGAIRWKLRVRWARDIAKAMLYLHTRTPQVVHRDLKSLNILLDDHDTVKLCDFGMARLREHTYIATQHISGSPSWMAPEVLRGDDFDDSSDVYAFGVICWELLCRKIPWPDKTMAQLVGLVGFSGQRLELPNPMPEGVPSGWAALLSQCFAPAKERPSFRTIKGILDVMYADVD